MIGARAALAVLLSTALTVGSATAAAGATPAPQPIGAGARCAWPVRADRETLNVAYPDTSATYWVQRYSLAPGEGITYRWTRPHARYSSFVVYDATGSVVGHRPDRSMSFDRRGRATISILPGEEGDAEIRTAPVGANGRSEIGRAHV